MTDMKTLTDTATGIRLRIVLDEMDGDTHNNPIANDEAVIFAVLHRRYINPAKDFREFDAEHNAYDFNSPEGIAQFEADMEADPDSDWVVFPLYMYDHSGTSYRCSEGGNPFSCKWDSGRVGIIALNKAEVGTPGKDYGNGQVAGSYLEQAQKTCEIYTAWANGEVYGYIVEDADGEQLDSCWGYVETDGADGYVLEAGQHSYKYHIAERLKEQAKEMEAERPDMYANVESV